MLFTYEVLKLPSLSIIGINGRLSAIYVASSCSLFLAVFIYDIAPDSNLRAVPCIPGLDFRQGGAASVGRAKTRTRGREGATMKRPSAHYSPLSTIGCAASVFRPIYATRDQS